MLLPLNVEFHEIDMVNRMILAKLIDAYRPYTFGFRIADVSCNEVHPFVVPEVSANTL